MWVFQFFCIGHFAYRTCTYRRENKIHFFQIIIKYIGIHIILRVEMFYFHFLKFAISVW